MPIEFAVTKSSGQGEQLTVVVKQWNPVTGVQEHENMADMLDLASQGLAFADLRMQEMNLRHLEAGQLEEWCDPGTWQKILDVLEILSGRVSISTVQHRWRSSIEETEALEAGRRAAMNGIMTGEV